MMPFMAVKPRSRALPPFDPGEDKLTVLDAARRLSVDYDTLHRWVKTGRVRYIRLTPTGTIRLLRRDVDRLMAVFDPLP